MTWSNAKTSSIFNPLHPALAVTGFYASVQHLPVNHDLLTPDMILVGILCISTLVAWISNRKNVISYPRKRTVFLASAWTVLVAAIVFMQVDTIGSPDRHKDVFFLCTIFTWSGIAPILGAIGLWSLVKKPKP